MFIRSFAVLVLFAPLTFSQQGAAEADLKAMQGTWVMEKMEVNGVDEPPQRLAGTTLTIKGKDYLLTRKKTTAPKVVLHLDPSKDPKHMDMVFQDGNNKDKTHKAIYRLLDKDRFQLCRGLNPDQERPTQFATWPDTNYFVVTWKREK